jgi:hypothetical protein
VDREQFLALAEPLGGGAVLDADRIFSTITEAGLPLTEPMIQSVGRDLGFAPQWVDDLGRELTVAQRAPQVEETPPEVAPKAPRKRAPAKRKTSAK